jgi:hypothetical protein
MEGGYHRKRKSKSKSKSRTRRSISRSRRLRQIKKKVASVARKLRSLTRSPRTRNRIFIIQRSPNRVPQVYIPQALPARSVYSRSTSSKGFFRPAIGPMKANEYQIGNRYYTMQE